MAIKFIEERKQLEYLLHKLDSLHLCYFKTCGHFTAGVDISHQVLFGILYQLLELLKWLMSIL